MIALWRYYQHLANDLVQTGFHRHSNFEAGIGRLHVKLEVRISLSIAHERQRHGHGEGEVQCPPGRASGAS